MLNTPQRGFTLRTCGAVFLVMCASVDACRSSVPHPPDFKDFQHSFQKGSQSDAAVEAQVEVFSAAMLSEREMNRILERGDTKALIGAGIQGHLDGDMDLRLLKHATEKSPAEPMAQVALAYRGLDLLANGVGDQQTTLTVTSNAIAAIRAIEPTNSVPLYLQGALDCLLTNVSAAKGLIVEAARTEGFNTYAVPLKLSIVHALESVGYSPYTARIVASGYASGVVAWSKLNKAVLGAEPSAEELRACHVLGARVAGGKSFLEQLVGDSIQTRSAGKMGGAEFAGEPQRIAEQKGRIKRATAYLDSARTRHVSESRWVEYYDRCFGVGELEAIEALAKANGDTF